MRVSAEVRSSVARWDSQVQGELLPAQVPAVVAETGSVLRPGAAESVLQAAESRLGVRLPPSYRMFLAVSDGAFADPWGPVTAGEEQWRQHSSVPGLGLLAAVDVAWLDQAVPDVVAAALIDFEPGEPLEGDSCPVLDVSPLLEPGRALLVSSETDGQLCALVRVDEGSEWQLWLFTRDDITGYVSFGSWLRWTARQSPSADDVAQLAEWANARDRRGNGLSEVSDPAAIPALVAALDRYPHNDGIGFAVTLALGRTRSDAAVPVLEHRLAADPRNPYRHRVMTALAQIGSPAARDALTRLRAWNELVELNDSRGLELALDAVARDEFYAANALREHPDPRFIPVLLEASVRATHPGSQLTVAAALDACGASEGGRLLEAIAKDPSHPKAAYAALYLGRH